MKTMPISGKNYVIRLGRPRPSYSHGFRQGEIVTAVRVDSGDPNAWHCRSDRTDEMWWVNIKDLEELDDGPTEEEVLKIFGLTPQPHCTTCTCYQD